ncbi:MAG: sigma 54-interacting transcriptional regulator, partial [Paracoccaceae bacterium]
TMKVYISRSESVVLHHVLKLVDFSGAQVECVATYSSDMAVDVNSIICANQNDVDRVGGEDVFLQIVKAYKPAKIFLISINSDCYKRENLLGGRFVKISVPVSEISAEITSAKLADLIVEELPTYTCGSERTALTLQLAKRVAAKDVTVLINGPTGTGKEVLSKFIHANSLRSDKSFVALNCAAIPENMLEAMLFGHEKGAFTGASSSNQGIFRAANHGTLLLDEISEMPLGLQAKLLRVLQEKEITPLGGNHSVKIDVRVIATTNRDMSEEIRVGNFREDLYYRLNVFPINTDALSQRPEDIIPIACSLLRKHTAEMDEDYILGNDAAEVLLEHNWPGNVRELENVIQRALVLSEEPILSASTIFIQQSGTPASLQSTESYLLSKVG